MGLAIKELLADANVPCMFLGVPTPAGGLVRVQRGDQVLFDKSYTRGTVSEPHPCRPPARVKHPLLLSLSVGTAAVLSGTTQFNASPSRRDLRVCVEEDHRYRAVVNSLSAWLRSSGGLLCILLPGILHDGDEVGVG
jgi:hypothetical protein